MFKAGALKLAEGAGMTDAGREERQTVYATNVAAEDATTDRPTRIVKIKVFFCIIILADWDNS
jgi:cystathionine beta-lyase family protein involved in aluminum resistance